MKIEEWLEEMKVSGQHPCDCGCGMLVTDSLVSATDFRQAIRIIEMQREALRKIEEIAGNYAKSDLHAGRDIQYIAREALDAEVDR
jgi:hypothetical protein